jgi:hypothetical protein
MGSLYEIRGDVEHLHEHRYLEIFNRAVRLDLVQKEAIAEHIARKALTRVVGTPTLWEHFGSTDGLRAFWRHSRTERERLWGTPGINPAEALEGYDPRYISDVDLGSR